MPKPDPHNKFLCWSTAAIGHMALCVLLATSPSPSEGRPQQCLNTETPRMLVAKLMDWETVEFAAPLHGEHTDGWQFPTGEFAGNSTALAIRENPIAVAPAGSTRPERFRQELAPAPARLCQEQDNRIDPSTLALRWLATHQRSDGSWTSDGRRSIKLPASNAATSLAVLAYLYAGHTHQTGPYRDSVRSGLRSLIHHVNVQANSKPPRVLATDDVEVAFAARAICEAYGVTGDRTLAPAAENATMFLLDIERSRRQIRNSQARFQDRAWPILAFHSAHVAYVSKSSNKRVKEFIGDLHEEVKSIDLPNATPEESANFLVVSTMISQEERRQAVSDLVNNGVSDSARHNLLVSHLLTFGHGHEYDDYLRWRTTLHEHLTATQVRKGTLAEHLGSWDPPACQRNGRVGETALNTMTLCNWIRYLPLVDPANDADDF